MSHSAISLGLGLGGGKSATSSGAPGGGAVPVYNIPSGDRQPEATILALSPTNPSGAVTVKFGSDTNYLYVWGGATAWYIFHNTYTP